MVTSLLNPALRAHDTRTFRAHEILPDGAHDTQPFRAQEIQPDGSPESQLCGTPGGPLPRRPFGDEQAVDPAAAFAGVDCAFSSFEV